MAYGPGLWRHFGLTVLTVWDLDIVQFQRCVTYIDDQQKEEEATDGR